MCLGKMSNKVVQCKAGGEEIIDELLRVWSPDDADGQQLDDMLVVQLGHLGDLLTQLAGTSSHRVKGVLAVDLSGEDQVLSSPEGKNPQSLFEVPGK